jgi:two-component system sensor histidine kinase AlgZ
MTTGVLEKRRPLDGEPANNEFFVPDLCRARAVFMLVITSEILVLLVAIIRAEGVLVEWSYLGLLSLFTQWTVLASAGVICALRRRLQNLGAPQVSLAITLIVALIVLVLSLISDRVLMTAHSQTGWNAIGRNLLLALIVTLLVLRYFYLQHQWQQQRQAEIQARLTALQARMHPHFLFNSMNTIASLIATRPEQAEEAVLDLSELFRASLKNQNRLTTLAEEISLCRRYLMIEQLRLGDRLTMEWAISDDLMEQAIPPLTLQPLVENAIYHGIQPRPEGGKITIKGYREGAAVYFMVQNPRAERSQSSHRGNRMALDNIQARLRVLFGESAVLKQSQQDDTHTVTLRLPWRTSNPGEVNPE